MHACTKRDLAVASLIVTGWEREQGKRVWWGGWGGGGGDRVKSAFYHSIPAICFCVKLRVKSFFIPLKGKRECHAYVAGKRTRISVVLKTFFVGDSGLFLLYVHVCVRACVFVCVCVCVCVCVYVCVCV